MADIMVATANSAPTLAGKGYPEVIEAGKTLAHSGHEIVTSYPDLWKPLDVHYAVEEKEAPPPKVRKGTATAAATGSAQDQGM